MAVTAAARPEPTRFGLIAQGIVGRRITVAWAGGGRTYCDGEAIYLADLPEELLCAATAVQAGLLAAGTFDTGMMTRLAARRSLRRRYLTLEAARAVALLHEVMPMRTRAPVAATYGGALPSSPRTSLAWAADRARPVPEAPEWLGTIHPLAVKWSAATGGPPPGQERDGSRAALRSDVEQDGADRSRILGLFSSPVGSSLSALFAKITGADIEVGSGKGPTAGTGLPGVMADGRPSSRGTAVRDPDRGGSSPGSDAAGAGDRYPEWDFRAGRYRPDHCTVTELDPPWSVDGPPPAPGTDRRLVRQLARLGLTHETHRRQPDGEDVDLSALTEWCLDRRREAASPRTLITTASLIAEGLSFRDAAAAAIVGPLTDDRDVRDGLLTLIDAHAPHHRRTGGVPVRCSPARPRDAAAAARRPYRRRRAGRRRCSTPR